MRSSSSRFGIAAIISLFLASTPLPGGTSQPDSLDPQSGAPPRETYHKLGTDSKGATWQLRVALNEPLTVFGTQRFVIPTREPFDLFEIHAVIDASDVAWIVDGKGRGVRVHLSDGKAEEFRVPVSRQLVGGIAVRDGKLFFGENPATGTRSVRQLDLASGAVKTVLTLEGAWSTYRLAAGPRRVWAVNWTGLASPEDTIELVALDWVTGAASTRGRRSMPRAAYVEGTLTVVEAPDGAAWVANGYTQRIERLDGSGRWQGWGLDGRTPSNLMPAPFGAVCVLRRLKPPKDTRTLEGVPFEQPSVLSREIGAFIPDAAQFLVLPVDADVRLIADPDGGVRVEGLGRLSIDAGRLQIAAGVKRP